MANLLDVHLEHLAEKHGLKLLPGYILRVKTTENHHIDLCRMIFNWRICTVPIDAPMFFAEGWCYRGPDSFETALEEAQKWPEDEPGDYTPDRWYKEVHTGRTQKQYANE